MSESTVGALLSLLLLQTTAGQPPLSVNQVVETVSQSVREFQNRIPDFLCHERITSATYNSGKLHEQKIVESIFTYSRKAGAHREIMSIDGKPAKKNAKMPGLPINWNNVSFGWLLEATFAPRILQSHDYVLGQTDESGRLAIQFVTKKDQQEIKWFDGHPPLVARDEGTAWIDIASMQAVRIARNFLNLPQRFTRLMATTDFGPIAIGETQFWLPKNLRVETAQRDPRNTALFVEEYSDCKKFGAEITILPH